MSFYVYEYFAWHEFRCLIPTYKKQQDVAVNICNSSNSELKKGESWGLAGQAI